MNVVLYLRYSDSKQRRESIEGQRAVCTEYAEQHGYTIVGEYVDEAFSARTDDRPNFLRMINDSKKKVFQAVIVYQLDRFSRDRYDSAKYTYALKKNDVKLISAKEAISDEPEGIVLESVLVGMAEYYSKELSRKVNRGMAINAEKCLSNGGATPLGYKIEDHRYVIDEKTAPIVREVYEKYADGWTVRQICENLNERGIKTSSGASFNRSSLHVMLKNRKYLGIYIYKGIEHPGGMPQIIDDELFARVAAIMEGNKAAPARSRAKAEYLLSGKLYCGYCKEKMIGHSSNQISKKGVIFNYYKCKNSGGGKSCKKKLAKKDYIEDVVVNECRNLLTPKNIKRIAKEMMWVISNMESKAELQRLEGLIANANREKDNQMKSLRMCSDDTIRNMIFEDLAKIGAEITELERQLEIEKARHFVVTEEQVIEFLESLAKGDVNDITYRRALIKMFVNKIFLYDDKFTITFNTGDEEVEISDKLFDAIENGLSGEKLCLSSNVAHQRIRGTQSVPLILLMYKPDRTSQICEANMHGFANRIYFINETLYRKPRFESPYSFDTQAGPNLADLHKLKAPSIRMVLSYTY